MPLAAPLVATLLAQAAPAANLPDASSPAFAYAVWGVVLGGIVTVVMVADRIDSMMERRRRKPSLDVDLVGLQGAITTLTTSVDELKAARDNHNGHKERINDLERRADVLEKQLQGDIASQRSYVAKTSHEIFVRIEGVEKSMASNLQAVERGMGRVEGTLEQLTERMKDIATIAAGATTAATAASNAATAASNAASSAMTALNTTATALSPRKP